MLLKTVSSSSAAREFPWRSQRTFLLCYPPRAFLENLKIYPSLFVFQLFEEVKKELDLVPRSSHVSLGRQKYSDEQIKFFKESSVEEREHAEKLIQPALRA
ncbi:hypothetical protein F2Q69_00017727 [Brassica cretica]|uniref:Ferritin n=1 Tax=Brassica cretica TaxID=69181 RepID=A0A8S9R9U3_BRACR|nr:hypothetical protein F2Q69_00017727 [Brassica cretica]